MIFDQRDRVVRREDPIFERSLGDPECGSGGGFGGCTDRATLRPRDRSFKRRSPLRVRAEQRQRSWVEDFAGAKRLQLFLDASIGVCLRATGVTEFGSAKISGGKIEGRESDAIMLADDGRKEVVLFRAEL